MQSFFFFNDTATTEIYTLSLHDALPISGQDRDEDDDDGSDEEREPREGQRGGEGAHRPVLEGPARSEEHTSELQSPCNLVCRLLLEKKKKNHRKLNIINSRFEGIGGCTC